MYILIDYREKSFINYLGEYYKIHQTNLENDINIKNDQLLECNVNNVVVKFKVTNLSVGDFILKKSKDIEEYSIIIERKTIKDLCASITDGRFRQQKDRLLESCGDPNKITFILEGNKKTIKNNKLSDTIVDSSILNLLYKHQYKVIYTDNELDTFNNIILLYKKLQNNDFEVPIKPSQPMKLVSKSEKIKENFLASQLSVIPGVSYSTALLISKEYNTMKDLIDAYNKCDDVKSKHNLLANIQINQKRKLGSAVSKKIYEALCE